MKPHLLNPDAPKVRLYVCRKCSTIEELPDYEGDPEGDEMLKAIVAKHQQSCGMPRVGGENAELASQQDRFLCDVERDKWNNPRTKQEIISRLSMGNTGFEEKVYGVRNTWREDAMECFGRHGRPVDCSDYKDPSKRLGNALLDDDEKGLMIASGFFDALRKRRKTKTTYLCDFCPVKSQVQQKVFNKRGLYDR